MKWIRTIVIFDRGNICLSDDWNVIHGSVVRSIESIKFPPESETLTLRTKSRIDGQWQRNGVGYLRSNFFEAMVNRERWIPEAQVGIERLQLQTELMTFPDLMPYQEPITSSFGHFDFMTRTKSGLNVAIEWETGNISSSHRSINKLTIAISAGVINAGILVLPSRKLYEHLTDRIGNIGELSPYLRMWSQMGSSIKSGMLSIIIVEQDSLTDDLDFKYLPRGNDGRARKK
ncbi:hypothetical protein ABM187_003379 [Stenotrophomonas maltophilia]